MRPLWIRDCDQGIRPVKPTQSHPGRIRRLSDVDMGSTSIPAMVRAARRGKSLTRPLTQSERRCLAVIISKPTHTLDISSTIRSHRDFTGSFSRFSRRMTRALGHPFVYFGCPARSIGDPGFHFHALTTEYLHEPVLRKHVREAGLGLVRFEHIEPWKPLDRMVTIAYRMSQVESNFGSSTHQKHRQPGKHEKTILRSSNRTLEARNPKLLSALKMAESRSVTDEDLLAQVPIFNR